MNWIINIAILVLIEASYVANRQAAYHVERMLTGGLIVAMGITVVYGILKLRTMQAAFDANVPPKVPK